MQTRRQLFMRHGCVLIMHLAATGRKEEEEREKEKEKKRERERVMARCNCNHVCDESKCNYLQLFVGLRKKRKGNRVNEKQLEMRGRERKILK